MSLVPGCSVMGPPARLSTTERAVALLSMRDGEGSVTSGTVIGLRPRSRADLAVLVGLTNGDQVQTPETRAGVNPDALDA